MNRRMIRFRSTTTEAGWGTEEGAFAYAMLLNGDWEKREAVWAQPLNEAQ